MTSRISARADPRGRRKPGPGPGRLLAEARGDGPAAIRRPPGARPAARPPDGARLASGRQRPWVPAPRDIRHRAGSRDYPAVRNGRILPGNSSKADGTTSKINLIKRQACGRAGLPLLRIFHA